MYFIVDVIATEMKKVLEQIYHDDWEDTDRGNLNIYYTSDQDQIDGFKKRLYDLAETQLKTEMTQKYQLTEVELKLLWEMSRMTKKKEVFQISTNVKTFELILNDLEKIDEERPLGYGPTHGFSMK